MRLNRGELAELVEFGLGFCGVHLKGPTPGPQLACPLRSGCLVFGAQIPYRVRRKHVVGRPGTASQHGNPQP